MVPLDLPRLRECVSASSERVQVLDSAAGPVVVKRQRLDRRRWRSRVISLLALLFGVPMLQAPAQGSGPAVQEVEVRRLRALAAIGAPVPPLLHVDDAFIVMARLDGRPLIELIEAGGPLALGAWGAGLDAIADLHRRGGYLSHAAARNFIATPDGLAMIDFESDPLESFSLDEAQARDWLTYLHSTAWLLAASPPTLRDELGRRLERAHRPVRELVARAVDKIAWMRHLPASRKPFGREVSGLRALAALAPVLAPSPPPPNSAA